MSTDEVIVFTRSSFRTPLFVWTEEAWHKVDHVSNFQGVEYSGENMVAGFVAYCRSARKPVIDVTPDTKFTEHPD